MIGNSFNVSKQFWLFHYSDISFLFVSEILLSYFLAGKVKGKVTSRRFRLAAGSLTALALTLASSPSHAQTVTVPSGTTQTDSDLLTGSGALTVTGGGTLSLTNSSNTYTGGTVVTGNSTLQVGSDAVLGTSPGAITLGGTGSTGTLDVSSTLLAVTSARPVTLDGNGGILIGGKNVWTFGATVSGTGSLTITSPSGSQGSILLSGTNTYSGGTLVNAGSTLYIGVDANLGASSGAVTLGDASGTGALALGNVAPVTTARSIILGSGGGIINSGAFSWTFTTPITGPGSLTIGGNTAVVLDGVNSYAGGTNVTAGTLEIGDAKTPTAEILGATSVTGGTLSGRGTVLGAVTNTGGTVSPGVDGIGGLTVGSYIQGSAGTLAISLLPTGAAQLNVTGSAALAGSLSLNALGALHAGTYQLLNAAEITGGFSTIANQISVGFDQSVGVNADGTAVDLTLVQRTSIPEIPSIYPALANTALDAAQRASEVALGRLGEARQMATLDRMVVAADHRHIVDDWGCAGCAPYGAWFKATGGFGTTDGAGGTPGYNANTAGFLAGIDGGIGEDSPAVIGVAIGYDHSAVDEGGGARGTISTPRLLVYGDWWRGPFALDAAFGGGYAKFSSARPITQTGATASASGGGPQFTGSVQASAMLVVRSLVVTPAIGMKFARQNEHAFDETGGGAYNLNGQSGAANSLRTYVSCAAATRFDLGAATRIEPTLRIAYSQEALRRSGISVNPTADDYTFHYPGIVPSRGQISLTAGATIERTRALNFFTDAGLISSGNTRGAQVDAGIRYLF